MKKILLVLSLILIIPINLLALKSTNTYLEELVVRGYEIDFDKTKNDYNITILESENSVSIKAVTEDLRSTYEVIGNTDLRKNNNKVSIIVTSESGDKNTYTLNINYEKEIIIEDQTFNLNTFYKENKNLFIIGGGVVLFIILVLIILGINGKAKDKKIDKMFDEM